MNEYMIRFTDGTIKHIKADTYVFMNLPSSDVGNKPVVAFYMNHEMHYIITLDSISAIRFPVDGDKNDELISSNGNT